MQENQPDATWWERAAIALLLAVLGVLTGVISVWMLTNLPGLDVGRGVYVTAALVLGLACFVLGFVSEKRALDVLGEIWRTVWKLSLGVLSAVRMLAR